MVKGGEIMKTKKMITRQWRFYDYLTKCAIENPKRWVGKEEIASALNGEYKLSKGTHDICSTMNGDRLFINNSLEVDKIILVKDNKFKIATMEESLDLEEEYFQRALMFFDRRQQLVHKRNRDNQGKLVSNQDKVIDDNSQAQLFHETFIKKTKD